MTFHYIEFLTYCHATEDPERVKEALHALTLYEVEWDESEAEGYHGNRILIFKGKLTRNREMDGVFKNLPIDVIDDLLYSLDKRVDDDCNFFFRVDKGEAYKGNIVLSPGDNTIRVRARVESYPSRRETALKKLQQYFTDIKS